jgi:hypothetical protein
LHNPSYNESRSTSEGGTDTGTTNYSGTPITIIIRHSRIPTTKRITWADSVTGGITPIATYQSATINPGIRRRRSTKAHELAADRAAFLSASITIHPDLTSISWEKRRPASRLAHCRKRGCQLPTPQSNHTQPRPNRSHIIIHHHMATFAAQITKTAAHLHSAFTVIDADTGKSYEHAQLVRGDNKKNGFTAQPINLAG